jgi:TatD DNase family protein
MFIDTHCHIQEAAYPLPLDETLMRAREAGVERMICVGTNVTNSNEAVEFAAKHSGLFATIGVHPHDTKDGYRELARLAERPEVVAVGEIGLDYFYAHSSREVQIEALQWQIDLALRHDLPIVFHVREAFDDFWPIFDNFQGIRGELHSFTDNQANLEAGLQRGLLIGVNGISTFTKDPQQQAVFASLPLEKMLLETDAPFLTPQPFRGKVNEPAFVKVIAEHHAALRGISLKEIADMTTANAVALFAL